MNGANNLLKKSIAPFFPRKSVSESVLFAKEIALAKPVAHDGFVFEPFFNRLLTPLQYSGNGD